MNAPFFLAADTAFRLVFPKAKSRLALAILLLAGLVMFFPSRTRAHDEGTFNDHDAVEAGKPSGEQAG